MRDEKKCGYSGGDGCLIYATFVVLLFIAVGTFKKVSEIHTVIVEQKKLEQPQ